MAALDPDAPDDARQAWLPPRRSDTHEPPLRLPWRRSRRKLCRLAALPAPFAWVIRGRIFLIEG